MSSSASASHGHEPSYLNAHKGWKSWLFTLDHKRIGIMYLAAVIFGFALGGLFAMLLRFELIMPNHGITSVLKGVFGDTSGSTTYNKLFTLHGAVMIFLFIIPSVPAALGNFVLPLMLGAKDVAFPRLNLLSFHIYLLGTLFFVAALINGGIDTGWTFYAPYSIRSNSAVVWAVSGAFILGFSSILTGINFIATIHAMRPPQMTWFRMPLFLWALYATACIQVLATPVLAITLVLIGMEQIMNVGIFDPALGGDAVLMQHFFWFYSHPAVYIMIVPPMGVVSELISTFSRKPVFGYRFVAYSSMAIAAVSFIVWAHHMFTTSMSEYSVLVFSLLTFLVGIPSAIKVFNWVATLYKGSISMDSPMLYALSFIAMFTIGGLTGLVCATLNTDIHLHDTYFIVAHFHYTMMGSAMVGFLGGMHYWWPKMFGRMYSEPMAKLACLGVFVGFNLTFIPQFFMGALGMPRRYHDVPAQFMGYHHWSTAGAMILAASFTLMLLYLLHSLKFGKPAGKNPWGGTTVEWQTETPPIEHNFHGHPDIPTEPYVYGRGGGHA